ncbi:MAG: hypothetical protein SVM86_05935 [Candidatus Cloacimonadota bacterium]|nr:hypothetical protein [Candidatus Cloacimonadota bacterium]
MQKILLIFLLLTITISGFAEISTGKAVLFSLVVPGSGHIYMKNYNKGGIYLGMDLAIILSYFRLDAEKKWKIDSFHHIAEQSAGLNPNSSDRIYQNAQNYISREEYNNEIIQTARNYFLIGLEDQEAYEEYLNTNLLPEENDWHWDNSRDWEKYKDLRRDKQDLEIYSNFAIAATILNRIVSTIDAMVTSKQIKEKLDNVKIEPNLRKNGLQVSYEIQF